MGPVPRDIVRLLGLAMLFCFSLPNIVSLSPPLRETSMWLSNSIFINRTNRADAVKTFSKAAKDMVKRKMSIFIFAEGTRTNREEIGMLPLKKGAFHLAVQGGFPIVPMVCENYYGLYAADKKRFEKGDLVIKGECRWRQFFPALLTVTIYQWRGTYHDTDCKIVSCVSSSPPTHLNKRIHFINRRYYQTQRESQNSNVGSTGGASTAEAVKQHDNSEADRLVTPQECSPNAAIHPYYQKKL
jgi:hypothetical protein